MKNLLRRLLLLAMLSIPGTWLKATCKVNVTDTLAKEIKPLEPGDSLPNLSFTSLVNSKKEILQLSDFKGKLVILDFWATWCASCVAAFPRFNDLQAKFKSDIQIIGVTYQNFDLINEFFKQRVDKQNLKLLFPSATEDTILKNYFPHQSVSHLVWISSEGKVLAITGSEEVTEENITKILKRKTVSLVPKLDRKIRADVDMAEPFILEKLAETIYKNEGVTEGGIRFKSIITKRIPDIPSGLCYNYTGRILCQNVPLESMFMNAYSYENLPTGEFLFAFPHNKFRWEVGKNNLYNLPSEKGELKTFRNDTNNYYCYELFFPDLYKGPDVFPERSEDVRFIAANIMKHDLMKWTGFKSSMEFKESKVLVLSILDSTKLVSPDKYEKSHIDPAFFGGTFKNMKMLHFKRSLYHFLQMAPPLIDETNYFGNINFRLKSKLTEYLKLSLELENYGLKLSEEIRTIPFLVVKD